jgi:hypothetical protein
MGTLYPTEIGNTAQILSWDHQMLFKNLREGEDVMKHTYN